MSRPNISKPITIRPPFVSRTIINQRVIDPTIIAKLFLICQEGQISNIKDYILKNGLTANDLVNTDGQSILHVILLNDSMTPREKTDIFKFLASRNLLKFSYDSQQKTPLHIAAEKQLTEIVKILINASHDVNALDSTRRTPIYYAITGTEVECPKKQKGLIEKKKTVKLGLQDELTVEIVKFINDNPRIKNLLQHLYNTTKKLDSIYNDEITRILEEDNKKIMEILITEKDEEKKKDKIFEKVYETRNSIINMFVKEKFTSTLKPISFNKVDANTWGPDENPVNKFLNDVVPSVILKDFELDYDKQKMIVITDLENNILKNLKDINEIREKKLQGIEDAIHDLNFYSIVYEILNKYSAQSLAGGSYKHQKNSKKIIKKIIKKYVQCGGATSAEITQVITFMTANIPALIAEVDIMNVLPQIFGKEIDNDPRFIRRFTRVVPINVNYLGQIYAKVLEINDTLINNNFLKTELRVPAILSIFIRQSNDIKAEKIAEIIYNTYQVDNTIFNTPVVRNALEDKPLILTHLVGFNNGQLFLILRANLINVINRNNDLFEQITFISALISTLNKFPTLISGSPPLRAEIIGALTNILTINPSFIFDKNLMDEYQKNNDLFDRLIRNLIPQFIQRPLVTDARLINLLKNNRLLFEKILERFTTANLELFPPPGLTPQNITDLTILFVSALIHYDFNSRDNFDFETTYNQIDPQLFNPIQAILDKPALVTNIRNAYTPHPTIAQITTRFRQFQPNDDVKRTLTEVLNNIPAPGINVANDDELAKLFSDTINLSRDLILNDTFINFISTQQTLLLKIITLQAGNDGNINTIFEKTIKAPGSTIGRRNPTQDYLIVNYKIVEELINTTRDMPVDLVVNLIIRVLQSPNVSTFINDIITTLLLITYLRNNKNLTAELVTQARGDLLVPIAKLLCVIDNNHENNVLVANLVKNVDLLQELCSNELRVDIPNIMSNENIAKLIKACVDIPRSTISKNTKLIDKIKANTDLAIELCNQIHGIPEDMLSKIILSLLYDPNSLSMEQNNRLKVNLENNLDALSEIIKNSKDKNTQNLLSEFLFEYFTRYNDAQIQILVPSFVSNKDLIYRLIENDNNKNPVNVNLIREKLAFLITNCFIVDRTLLTDKNIIRLLINEQSVINFIIDKIAVLPPGFITNDDIAQFIKIFIIQNNAVSSVSLIRLNPDIMILIIQSDYTSNIEYNMITQAILAMVERNVDYFDDAQIIQIAQIINNVHPLLINFMADKQSTDSDNKIEFVAKLLNILFGLFPELQTEKIKNILLNNRRLIDKMNELLVLPPPPVIVGRLTRVTLEQLCKYDGILHFRDHRINDNTEYNLDVIRDDIMINPDKPKIKLNDDFHSEYEQLIKDSQPDFTVFNGGTNFIRKIKVIHGKIKSLFDLIETIIGRIKTELAESLNTINIKVIFENLIEINAQILSIVNYFYLFNIEYNLVKGKINKIIIALREEVKQLKTENRTINIPSKNKKIEYQLFYELLLKTFEKLDSTTKQEDVHDLYKNLLQLQDSLNKSITFINTVSATKYIIAFNNNFNDFDTIMTSGAANQIENIFDRNIPFIPKLYAKFETILSEMTQNLQLNKFNLVTKFIPQMNQYNFFSFYQVGGVQQPQIGFMVPQNYLNRTILSGEPKLTYGTNGITGVVENANSTNQNNLLQYIIGIKNGFPANRKIEAFNSINTLLDKHFLIIKNFLIRDIVNELYKILKSTTITSSLKDLLSRINNDFKDKLNLPTDNLQLFLIMLAKNIDQILTTNLINFILNGITRFGFRENRHQELKNILDFIAEIKQPGVDDDSQIQIINTNLEELTKPDDIIAVIKAKPDAYRLEYEEPVTIEKIQHIKKVKPIGLSDINVDKCFKTDIDLIKLFIEHKASTDRIIDNVIETNNPDILRLLIDKTAVYNEKSRNANGLRPYDLSVSQIKYFGSIIESSLIDNLIEDSSTEITRKTSTTLQMRYHELFYRIFYVLFNHLLLDLTNEMKYDNKKKLRRKLEFTKEAFPLKNYINYITLIKRTGDDYVKDRTNVINRVVDMESKDNEDKIKQKIEIEDKIKDLQKELNDIEDKPTEIRKQIIEDEIRELKGNLASLTGLETTKQGLIEQQKTLRKNNISYSNDIIINKMKALEKKKNFMDMYESLDENVFERDIKTVNNVWSSIFKKENLDKIDLIKSLSKYIETEKSFEDNYEEIKEFLNIIRRFASDYAELDQQLHSENYALEKIYEILSYIIKHTITINLINIIQQLLRAELIKITPQQAMTSEKYSELIDAYVNKILETSKLVKYIQTTFIDKIIIDTFNLTTEKVDLQQHFNYITKILGLNGMIPITSDSEIVKILTNNIYPYFVVYTEVNLKKIKTLISGLFNLMTNLDYSFEIYKMISDKAKQEK